ncbi:hypothetical protein OG883_23475 [Streptomyces sp. NBC_01142]|uniref:hypothetical protein n=1 Tax=Streptomyces sp. NBC_01142 TaxID=2975865 RepID=UPI00224EE25E|nr:hypothetical protein [Streptomyces sp. NBC_01142]MCX4822805.1 hypothetical protein [Streptomyces sp. NBC_01142]
MAHIRRLERTRFRVGSTAQAFRRWAALAHGPLSRLSGSSAQSRCDNPEECGCDPGYFRDHLEDVMHALPKKSARELRTLVGALDARILARARAVRADSPDVPWWRDQL